MPKKIMINTDISLIHEIWPGLQIAIFTDTNQVFCVESPVILPEADGWIEYRIRAKKGAANA